MSAETAGGVDSANDARKKNSLRPLVGVSVPLVDGGFGKKNQFYHFFSNQLEIFFRAKEKLSSTQLRQQEAEAAKSKL